MNKEKIKVEIYTNADRAFEDIADEILKDKDKKAIINILRKSFDLEDSLLEIKELQDENKMQDHELERLRAELKLEEDNRKYLNEQIERLHSIIKEVREYIENEYEENIIIVDYLDNPITPQDLYGELLEILDKENK